MLFFHRKQALWNAFNNIFCMTLQQHCTYLSLFRIKYPKSSSNMIGKFPQSIKTVFESSERHCNTVFFLRKGAEIVQSIDFSSIFVHIYTMLFLYTYISLQNQTSLTPLYDNMNACMNVRLNACMNLYELQYDFSRLTPNMRA